MMRRESGTAEPLPQTGDNTAASAETTDDLLTTMIQNLLNGAEAPPREVEGVSEEFCDSKSPTISCGRPVIRPQLLTPPKQPRGVESTWANSRVIRFPFFTVLDRVPKSSLDSSQTCPICNNPFLEDEYPLVVRLPCHPTHLFDLECVRPWLRLRGTCPLDRFDFAKQQREKDEERKRIADEDEEEEWDGMYG